MNWWKKIELIEINVYLIEKHIFLNNKIIIIVLTQVIKLCKRHKYVSVSISEVEIFIKLFLHSQYSHLGNSSYVSENLG